MCHRLTINYVEILTHGFDLCPLSEAINFCTGHCHLEAGFLSVVRSLEVVCILEVENVLVLRQSHSGARSLYGGYQKNHLNTTSHSLTSFTSCIHSIIATCMHYCALITLTLS